MVDRQHILDYLWADFDRTRDALVKEGISPIHAIEHLVDQLTPIQRETLKTLFVEDDRSNMRTPSPHPGATTPNAPIKSRNFQGDPD
jgi:hypothetical protein